MQPPEGEPVGGSTEIESIESIRDNIADMGGGETKNFIRNLTDRVRTRVADLKNKLDLLIRRDGVSPDRLEGTSGDLNTAKGVAVHAEQAVRYILEGARAGKIRTDTGADVRLTRYAEGVIGGMSRRITTEDISEQSAVYLFNFFDSLLEGNVTGAEDLEREFNGISGLRGVSPTIYRHVAETCADIVVATGEFSTEEASEMFSFEEASGAEGERALAEMVAKAAEEEGRERISRISLPYSARISAEEDYKLREFSKKLARSDTSFEDRERIYNQLYGEGLEDEDRGLLGRIFSPEEIAEIENVATRLNTIPPGTKEIDEFFKRDERDLFTYEALSSYLGSDGKIKPESRRLLKKTALRAVNRLLSRVDEHPDSQFSDNYSDFHEGRYYRSIMGVIREFANDPRVAALLGGDSSDQYRDFLRFMKDGVLQEISREREVRELYHNIGIWIKQVGPEEITKFVSRYDVSLLATPLTSDTSGKLVDIALSTYERFVQENIGRNNNQVRPGLFTGGENSVSLIYSNEDRERLRAIFVRTLKEMQIHAGSVDSEREGGLVDIQQYDNNMLCNFEDWEIDRAIKYARGISLMTTARGFEIIATAEPPSGFEGSADNFYNMAAYFNPRWKMKFGRGGVLMHIPEIHTIEADTRPKSLLRRIFCKGWNPEQFHRETVRFAGSQAAKHWTEIEDKWLFKNEEFDRLMRIFGSQGAATSAGWKLNGAKETYKKANNGKELKEDWEAGYKWFTKTIGAGSRFFFDEDRAKAFARALLFQELGLAGKIKAGKIPDKEQELRLQEYLEGKKSDKTIFHLNGQALTVTDSMEARMMMYRGENFYALLRRSPADFLNNLLQICPEVLPDELGGKDDYYFDLDWERVKSAVKEKLKGSGEMKKYKTELEKVKMFQTKMVRRWGRENVEHLRFVRGFYKRVAELGRDADGNIDKNKALDELSFQLSLAFEKARLENREAIEPSDVDGLIKDLLFNKTNGQSKWGLIAYFEHPENRDDFGDDKELKFGNKGFFYHMGRTWYTDMGHNLHPNTADVDWRLIFKNMSEHAGEDMVKRQWSGMKSYQEIIDSFADIDHILGAVCKSGDLKPVYELHQLFHKLEESYGPQSMYEAQYYLATIVGRFFQENWKSRIPFPFGSVYSLFRGDKLALSRIRYGKDAFTMTQDGLNEYFANIQSMGHLGETGKFSSENLSKSFGADKYKILMTETIPNATSSIILFLLWYYMFRAINEEIGGGEKRRQT